MELLAAGGAAVAVWAEADVGGVGELADAAVLAGRDVAGCLEAVAAFLKNGKKVY